MLLFGGIRSIRLMLVWWIGSSDLGALGAWRLCLGGVAEWAGCEDCEGASMYYVECSAWAEFSYAG